MTEDVLIIGATSGIARELCHVLARRGCRLAITGRSEEELQRLADDMRVRYHADVVTDTFEATNVAGHGALVDRCIERFDGRLTGAVLCHGYLPDQSKTQTDFSETETAITVNLTSAVSVLDRVASHLEKQGHGYIVGVSSVAGDRGRQSNYTYGMTKAALTAYLQGLRNRLFRAGVHVLTVKPGFVDTPMTHGRINPNSPLVASPRRVAEDIDHAIRKRKNVLYTPWFWRYILAVIGAIPEWAFKRLKL